MLGTVIEEYTKSFAVPGKWNHCHCGSVWVGKEGQAEVG